MGNASSFARLEETEPVRIVTGTKQQPYTAAGVGIVTPAVKRTVSPPPLGSPSRDERWRSASPAPWGLPPVIDSILVSASRVDATSATGSLQAESLSPVPLASSGGTPATSPQRSRSRSPSFAPGPVLRSMPPPSSTSPVRLGGSPCATLRASRAAANSSAITAVGEEGDFDGASHDSWSDEDEMYDPGEFPAILSGAFLSMAPGEGDHCAGPRSRLSFSESGKRVGFGFNKSTSSGLSGAQARLTMSLDRGLPSSRSYASGNANGELPPVPPRSSVSGSYRGASVGTTSPACSATPPLSSGGNGRPHGPSCSSGDNAITASERTENTNLFAFSGKSSQEGASHCVLSVSSNQPTRCSSRTPAPGTSPIPVSTTAAARDLSRPSSATQEVHMGSRRSSSTVCFNASVELPDGAATSHNTQALQLRGPHRDAIAHRSSLASTYSGAGRGGGIGNSRHHLAPLWSPPRVEGGLLAPLDIPCVAQVLSLQASVDEDVLRSAREASAANPLAYPHRPEKRTAAAHPLRCAASPSIEPPAGSRCLNPSGPASCHKAMGTTTASITASMSLRSGTLLRASAETVAGGSVTGWSVSPSIARSSVCNSVHTSNGGAGSLLPSPLPVPLAQSADGFMSLSAQLSAERVKTHPAKPLVHVQRNRLQLRQGQKSGSGSGGGCASVPASHSKA